LPAEPYHKPGTARLHEATLAEGIVSPDAVPGSARAENGLAGYGVEERSKYVMGDDGSLTDDEEGGGGYMD
jgi:palmitoyltransferase